MPDCHLCIPRKWFRSVKELEDHVRIEHGLPDFKCVGNYQPALPLSPEDEIRQLLEEIRDLLKK